MYKMLIFLKKNDDELLLNHFVNVTFPFLKQLSDGNSKLAELDGGLLTEEKFVLLCETVFTDRNQMNQLMQSHSGKELNKDLAIYRANISVFFADFKSEAN